MKARKSDPDGTRHRPVTVFVGALVAGVAMLALGASVSRSASPGAGAPPDGAVTRTPSAPPAAVSVRPASFWANKFLESWEYDRENGLPASRSPDSWQHYEISYDVDANTAMYRATGELRYLDRALEYVDNVVAAARVTSSLPTSQYRDRYLGWVSSRPGLEPTGIEVPLYESYFWRYATTLLRVMRQTPAVHADPAYRDRYEKLRDFAEIHIFDKWYNRGADDNIYRSHTHMAAHWATIALNLSLTTDEAYQRARYQKVVENIDQHMPNYPSSLRGQLRPHPVEPSAYFWSDAWGFTDRPGQDVSHANGVLAYLAEAKDQGRYWTAQDMAAFGALLTQVVWPAGRTYAGYVDGTGSDNGWFSDGFVKLGRYDRQVQQRLEQHQVVNAQFAANMALNATLLS